MLCLFPGGLVLEGGGVTVCFCGSPEPRCLILVLITLLCLQLMLTAARRRNLLVVLLVHSLLLMVLMMILVVDILCRGAPLGGHSVIRNPQSTAVPLKSGGGEMCVTVTDYRMRVLPCISWIGQLNWQVGLCVQLLVVEEQEMAWLWAGTATACYCIVCVQCCLEVYMSA